MTKEEQQVILSAKRWWARKRPLGWTLKQHLAQRTVNCIGAAEQRIGHTVAKLILGAQEPPQPDASQGSAPGPCCEGARRCELVPGDATTLRGWTCHDHGWTDHPPAAPQGSPLPVVAWPTVAVEAVARAIFAADALHSEGGAVSWDGITAEYQEDMRAVALAALAAAATPEGGALEGELAGCLRVRLEQEIYGGQCSRCGGTWQEHHYVRLMGGLSVPCPLAEPCALLARYDASKAIPQSGTVKEGT